MLGGLDYTLAQLMDNSQMSEFFSAQPMNNMVSLSIAGFHTGF